MLTHFRKTSALLVAVVGIMLFSSCGSDSSKGHKLVVDDKAKAPTTTKDQYSDKAKSVTAELGGDGFEAVAESLGFETNTDYESFANKDAQKGGELVLALDEFPATLRSVGKDSRSQVISFIESLVYEPLLGLDAQTLQFVPSLATHWKISEDKMVYTFRIDPRARWSDGKPVSSKDVIATYDLLVDEGIQSPSENGVYGDGYERPVALSDYLVQVKCKKENWRSFLYIGSSMAIFPAHHLEKVNGENFLKKYQSQMMPGTGPYKINLDDTKAPDQLVVQRRNDYWAANFEENKGIYNFDRIKFIFVLDERLRLEKFKKGDFDIYLVFRAQWWVEEFSAAGNDDIKRGLLQKAKIFNYNPAGTSGLYFNTQEAPFDDINVRKAIGYLWNIEQLNEKLFFNEYERCVSYYQGSIYQNKNNPIPTYNPDKAIALLKKAGYEKKAGEKWMSKNGKPFEIDLELNSSLERIFTPFQQDLEKVGIKLNLLNITPQARFKKIMKRQFSMTYQNWTGLTFPNPETSMHSKYAEELETNNITGMADKRIDALCERYDKSYDVAERISLVKEIDSLAVAGNYVAFGWVAPYSVRCVYWDKFDMPKTGLSYSGDFDNILTMWSYNSKKDKDLESAKTDKSKTLKINKVEIDPFNRKNAISNQP